MKTGNKSIRRNKETLLQKDKWKMKKIVKILMLMKLLEKINQTKIQGPILCPPSLESLRPVIPVLEWRGVSIVLVLCPQCSIVIGPLVLHAYTLVFGLDLKCLVL